MTLTRDEIERELEQLHQESYAWALACCKHNPSEAEDVLQMTYLKILDGSAQFAGRSTFRTWLFGVIRRTAARKWRNFVNRDRLLHMFFQHQHEATIPGIDVSLEYPDNARRLVNALRLLSRRQRDILQLVFYHGMTIEEAANALGISLGSARTHYARGKRNLANRLGELSS